MKWTVEDGTPVLTLRVLQYCEDLGDGTAFFAHCLDGDHSAYWSSSSKGNGETERGLAQARTSLHRGLKLLLEQASAQQRLGAILRREAPPEYVRCFVASKDENGTMTAEESVRDVVLAGLAQAITTAEPDDRTVFAQADILASATHPSKAYIRLEYVLSRKALSPSSVAS